MLPVAIILITSALAFYTLGVWAERRSGTLKRWHAASFLLGLVFDASGTYIMSQIAAAGGTGSTGLAATLSSVMAVTGAIALLLMLVHAAWAVVTLVRNRPAELKAFHKWSVIVWLIWLVPYFTGMASSMVKG